MEENTTTSPEVPARLPSQGGSYVRQGDDLKRVEFTEDAAPDVAPHPKAPSEE